MQTSLRSFILAKKMGILDILARFCLFFERDFASRLSLLARDFTA